MQSKSYIELIVSPVSFFQLVFNLRNVTVHETLYMILDKHATATKKQIEYTLRMQSIQLTDVI